jgi:iron complex outermembrane receptor protein
MAASPLAIVAAGQSSASEGASVAGEIIVTARRKEESIQDVPVAITALSGKDLVQKGVESPQDLRAVTSGLNVSGQTRDSATFFLRGQQPGAGTTGARNVPGVATYFAEVPADIATAGSFYDLQNVQVLKGPQGTLFGRNTTGGAVLFEPHHPEQNYNGGYAQFEYGNYNDKKFTGVLNIAPVADVLALRVATEIQRRDGYTKSIITGQRKDDRKHEAVRGSILFTPSDRLENLTIVDYRHSDTAGSGLVIKALVPDSQISSVPLSAPAAGALSQILGTTVSPGTLPLNLGGSVFVGCLSAQLPGCPAPIAGQSALGAYAAVLNGGSFYLIAPTSTYDQILTTQAAIGPRRNQSPFLTESYDQHIAVVNKTTFTLTDSLKLKNIFSYRKRRQREALDYTGTPLPLLQQFGPAFPGQQFTTGADTLTEELQLQGQFGDSLNFILGGYYEKVKPGIRQGSIGTAGGRSSIRSFNFDDNSKAVFGHVEWSPIHSFTLAAGLRRTWDERNSSISIFKSDFSCGQSDPLTGEVTCPIVNSKKFAAWSYDITASYKPSNELLLYAAFRRGYKSGGLNVPAVPGPPEDPLAFTSYGAEYVNDLEIGAKVDSQIGGVPFRFNIAAFHDNYTNQQISVTVTYTDPVTSETQFTSAIQNVGESRIQGVEADMAFNPVHGLTLGGFMSYLDAAPKRDVYDVLGRVVAFGGRQLPNQPKWKWGINGSYTYDLQDNGSITAAANYSWQDGFYASLQPVPGGPFASYGVLNARLSWDRVLGSNVDLAAFANNLTNNTYQLGGYPVTQLGFTSVIYGEPRMYGLSAKIRFGDER